MHGVHVAFLRFVRPARILRRAYIVGRRRAGFGATPNGRSAGCSRRGTPLRGGRRRGRCGGSARSTRALRCRSHTSSVECVYGRPRVSAKRGVEARSVPRQGLAVSRVHNACAALVGSVGRCEVDNVTKAQLEEVLGSGVDHDASGDAIGDVGAHKVCALLGRLDRFAEPVACSPHNLEECEADEVEAIEGRVPRLVSDVVRVADRAYAREHGEEKWLAPRGGDCLLAIHVDVRAHEPFK
eukprot:5380518-Pleurochrysis_carterae.AAC.1